MEEVLRFHPLAPLVEVPVVLPAVLPVPLAEPARHAAINIIQ